MRAGYEWRCFTNYNHSSYYTNIMHLFSLYQDPGNTNLDSRMSLCKRSYYSHVLKDEWNNSTPIKCEDCMKLVPLAIKRTMTNHED